MATEDEERRLSALMYAQTLSQRYDSASASSLLADASKIEAFIKEGTVPTEEPTQ
jgi:hypothetical protein